MNQESGIMNYGKQKGVVINSIIHPSTDGLFMIRLRKGFTRYNTAPGFTLIELLIVIAILGIIAAGIVTALNVTGTLGKASLAKAKTFAVSIENDLSINQVGKWSFEDGTGSTTFKDTSGYNNNGSCSGASCPTWKNAADCGLGFGGCLSFDGSDDSVGIGAVLKPDSTQPFTYAAWVRPTDKVSRTIISTTNSRANLFSILVAVVHGRLVRMVEVVGLR